MEMAYVAFCRVVLSWETTQVLQTMCPLNRWRRIHFFYLGCLEREKEPLSTLITHSSHQSTLGDREPTPPWNLEVTFQGLTSTRSVFPTISYQLEVL
jgi:hypothetical protein